MHHRRVNISAVLFSLMFCTSCVEDYISSASPPWSLSAPEVLPPGPLLLAAGGFQTCAQLEDSLVRCWGFDGDSANDSVPPAATRTRPVIIEGLEGMLDLKVGGVHACALHRDSTVRCWGNNRYGQLGDGTTQDSLTPVTVRGLTDVKALALGYWHSCALIKDGSVRCWGRNQFGSLGDGSREDRLKPVEVKGLKSVRELSAGYAHTCASFRYYNPRCWGALTDQQFSTDTPATPVSRAVAGGEYIKRVSSGGGSSMTNCGFKSESTLSCWGYNAQGQLGDGTTMSRMQPVRIERFNVDLAAAASVSLGAHHVCAVDYVGDLFCWGSNQYGQAGLVSEGNRITTPQRVEGFRGVDKVVTGFNHTCVMLRDDTIWCWGQNHQGQLGDGTTTDRAKLVQVVF